MRRRRRAAAMAVLLWLPAALAAAAEIHPGRWPAGAPGLLLDPGVEARIDALMASMSREEKVGQTIQADIASVTPEDLREIPLGAILAGGGSGPGGDDLAPAAAWLALADRFYRVAMTPRPGHAAIPPLFGIDAVHGHNNIVGATLFPHNVGLGAAHDADLVRRVAAATAVEVAVTGLDWVFAPTVALAQDRRWGRSYESYSDDPALVGAYATAMISGLQGGLGQPDFAGADKVVATAKHFIGDGGTLWGRDQGDTPDSEDQLIARHAAGYVAAVAAGSLTVMASYSSWQGAKMHGQQALLTDVLKQRLGFNGLVVGDWNAHDQLPGCTDASCAAAFNAGIDMFMVSDRWRDLFANTLAQVQSGIISPARLDDAVRRILRVKLLAGLFDKGPPGQRRLAGQVDQLGSRAHRALAREAAARSLVLLKNDHQLLPLRPDRSVLVAGDGADNIAKQAGGWTLSWQGGNAASDFPGATSIYAGIKARVEAAGGRAELSVDGRTQTRPDVAIVVFGEDPYAEFAGDRNSLAYQPRSHRDRDLLRRLTAQGIPTVAVFLSGRPLAVNAELNAAAAFVAAWLPGSEGAAIADRLFTAAAGDVVPDFTGRLPFAWPGSPDAGQPPLFARGYGLSLADPGALSPLPEYADTDPSPGRLPVVRGGYVVAPWSITLSDDQGALRATLPRQTSGGGALSLAMVTAGGQPGVIRLDWHGAPASVGLSAPAAAWQGFATADLALQLRWRALRPPSVSLRWNGADLSGLLTASRPGQWLTTRLRLSCIAPDWQSAPAQFSLAGAGDLSLEISDVALVADGADARCALP